MGDKVTLASRADTYSFRPGIRLRWRTHADGSIGPHRWYHTVWDRLTWFRQPRAMVTEVDQENGTITVRPLRWSWLRWRWM